MNRAQVNDAYTVLLREKQLPMSLLEDPEKAAGGKAARVHLLATQVRSQGSVPNRAPFQFFSPSVVSLSDGSLLLT